MPIARIPNKVLTLMQTEDKKMGKIVSLQKNLEWSTKEVLGAAVAGENIEGLEMAGRVMERQHLGEYIVGKASGPRHLLWRQREELGKVSPAMGGREGELFTPPRAATAGKGTFSLHRKARYLHRKGAENNGWGGSGSKQLLRGIF